MLAEVTEFEVRTQTTRKLPVTVTVPVLDLVYVGARPSTVQATVFALLVTTVDRALEGAATATRVIAATVPPSAPRNTFTPDRLSRQDLLNNYHRLRRFTHSEFRPRTVVRAAWSAM